MAPRGALAHRLTAPGQARTTLRAAPAEWPGLKRRFAPRRKYLTRWTNGAPVRPADPGDLSADTPKLLALIESDFQVLFGEGWDLVRAYPSVASILLGLLTGYLVWG